jgi:hypothetical protein
MIEFDPDQFETELQGLRPAKPSRKILDGIFAELEAHSRGDRVPPPRSSVWRWWRLLRWLVPTAAAAAALAFLIAEHGNMPQKPAATQPLASSARPLLKADKVEIDRQLVAGFDAIARLPGGEPIRFRCQQWMDKVRLRDSGAGLVIERTTPRLEIVPVRFETY